MITADLPGIVSAAVLCKIRMINPVAVPDIAAMSAMPFGLLNTEHVHSSEVYDTRLKSPTEIVSHPLVIQRPDLASWVITAP
jgi:hypothetical protein